MKKSMSILGSGWLGQPLIKMFNGMGYAVSSSTTSFNKICTLQQLGSLPFLIDLHDLKENIRFFLDTELLIINITSKQIDKFERLIHYIKKSSIRQVLFISSTSVYKNINQEVFEDENYLNDSPLVTIEKMFINACEFETTILRLGGLFGPGRHPGKFFLKSNQLKSPTSPVNLIHLDDCLEIIKLIILQSRWGEVYNAVADSHPSKKEFYSLAASLLGHSLESGVEQSNSKIVSNIKLKTHLNYKFIHSDLIESLKNAHLSSKSD